MTRKILQLTLKQYIICILNGAGGGGRTHNLKLGKHRSFFLFSGFVVISSTAGTMISSCLVPKNRAEHFANTYKTQQNSLEITLYLVTYIEYAGTLMIFSCDSLY